MTYATLMVHLRVDPSKAPVLAMTRQLAKRFGMAVIGITASQSKTQPSRLEVRYRTDARISRRASLNPSIQDSSP